jgi:Tat protein translocase TatB subunit
MRNPEYMVRNFGSGNLFVDLLSTLGGVLSFIPMGGQQFLDLLYQVETIVSGHVSLIAANTHGQYHGFMNLGMSEMLFIFLLALIVFGPKRLPELARQLGKIMADFKRATNDFKYQLENEIEQLDIQAKNEEREKLRLQTFTSSEPTILPPPPTGAVPSTLSTPAGLSVESATSQEEHVPEQLSFAEPEAAPEPAHDLQREPNV